MNRLEFLRIHPADNVAVALTPLAAGRELEVDGRRLTLLQEIAAGHKFALTQLAVGAPVIKYGMPIGEASAPIAPGAWVHTHNLRTRLSGQLEYRYEPAFRPLPPRTAAVPHFQGFRRADGRVGIRNELWIVPTVGCVNQLARNLAESFRRELPVGSVSRVQAWVHPYGCSQLGSDHETTAELLAALVRHPNAGGVLVVGLGCENNTLESFRARLKDVDPDRVRFMKAQEEGDEQARGLELLRELLAVAGRDRRQPVPVSELKVGMKCGGSDGFSGITANPLIGRFSDRLLAAGGSTVLSEVPEMFGAETLLLNRALTPEIFQRGVRMINDFKAYFERYGQVIYENPSPGNKAGGISTLEEKSLGCTQKGGSAPVAAVLHYGEPLTRPGLNLLTGPGNDLVATTVLAAAQTQLVLFSTGRGTPYGGPVPTVKIASNSDLAARKPNWIDFDAGRVLTGTAPETLDDEFFDYVLRVASGEETRNEQNHYQEIAIFKDGVTL